MTQPAWKEIVSERSVSTPQGGGGAPGTSEVIVANEAAASAIVGLLDGQQVFIRSHRSWWRFNANSTAPLVAHVVIASASAGASPRLLRTAYAAPEWRESITDVYWDPANVTGIANDENHAIFDAPQVGNARQPVLSAQELFRRWGSRNVINTGDLVGLVWTLHIISKQPLAGAGNDPLVIDWINFVDSFPRIVGEAATAALGPVALTAFTAQNPAVPAPGGTACSIQIGATVWGPLEGKRIRRISDGSVAYILKDLGAGVARISQPQTTDEAVFASSPTNVIWAAGNDVVVEDLTDVNFGRFHQGNEGSALGFAGQMNVLDVNIMNSSGGGDFVLETIIEDSESSVVFYQCTLDRPVSQDYSATLNGCGSRVTYFGTGAGMGQMYGGAVIIPAGAFGFVEVFGAGKQFFNFGVLDFFTYVQNGHGVLVRGWGTCGTFSIWDTTAQPQLNPGGHALQVGGGPNTSAGSCAFALRSATPIWGTGAAAKGIRVASSSRVVYQTLPNVTGAGGDFQLADSVLGLWGDFATGTYQPPGGIALTWAALAAAAGIAGFGGSAHNHNQDAHVNKAAAT